MILKNDQKTQIKIIQIFGQKIPKKKGGRVHTLTNACMRTQGKPGSKDPHWRRRAGVRTFRSMESVGMGMRVPLHTWQVN